MARGPARTDVNDRNLHSKYLPGRYSVRYAIHAGPRASMDSKNVQVHAKSHREAYQQVKHKHCQEAGADVGVVLETRRIAFANA